MGDPFVGRQAQLGLLDAGLAEVRSGRPEILLLTGPAGIGKSALVRRFLGRADDLNVLQATGQESDVSLAYGVLEQLLRAAGSSLAEIPGVPPSEAGAGADPFAVGAALVELLGTLDEERPIAIIVDDAQWADTASFRALLFALRRLRVERVLALVLAREDEGVRIPEGFARLADERGAELRLRGLDSSELRELGTSLCAGTFSAGMAERLYHHTGGNPLYARELLEEFPPEAWLVHDAPPGAPRSFAALVRRRLAGCPLEGRRLAGATAVLGKPVPLAVAAELAGIAKPLRALEAAVSARLLEAREGMGGPVVAFSHALVETAVYHDITPARRARLHARAAELVKERPASLHHRVAAASGHDEGLTAEVAASAREAASRGGWVAAARDFLAAARLSPHQAERERFFLEAIDCVLLDGDAAGAARLAEEVASFADSARKHYVFGHLAFLVGQRDRAEELLSVAWEQCDPAADGSLAGGIAELLAHTCVLRCAGTQAIEWGRRALRNASAGVRPVALTNLAVGFLFAGRPAEGLALVADASEPGPDAGPADLGGLLGRGMLSLYTDDLARACADLATVAKARWASFRTRRAGLGWLSVAEYRRGDWDGALADAELGASAAADAEQTWMLSFFHAQAVYPLASRGEWERAEHHAQASAEAYRVPGEAIVVELASAEAHLAFTRGDHERVLRAVAPVVALQAKEGISQPGIWPWRELWADALVSLGRLEEADAALVGYEAAAAKAGRHSSLANAARIRGRLEAARGRFEQAESVFKAGLDHAGNIDMAFTRARLQLAYGEFLRGAGRHREASEQLQAAEKTLARLDAKPFLEQCQQELSACGLPATVRAPLPLAQLTAPERAVARLVGSGLTNRQAAAELLVSPKTVQFHLASIFAKLGVNSRSQLALRLANKELPPPDLEAGTHGEQPNGPAGDAFVGRQAELELLAAQLTEVRRGSPRLVLVEGPAGIGKTVLLRRFLSSADDLRLLRASGEETEAVLAYGVVDQLVRAAGTLVPEALERLTAHPNADPLVVGSALVDLLGTLQDDGPVAIVVDDAQWADALSLRALLFALRRLLADHVLAVVSTRGEAPAPLPDGFSRMAAHQGVHVHLGGLDTPEVRALAVALGGTLSVSMAARLRDHTGGNPLHTRALLDELTPDTMADTDGSLPVPRPFGFVVLSRLAACSAQAQDLVAAASVLGPSCPLTTASALAGLDDPLPALEEAIRARVLELSDGPAQGIVAFPHALVRAAVYHDLGPARRATLHSRAAALVEEEGASLRHRVAGVSSPDADLAARLARFARDEATRGAWSAAARDLLSAAELSPDRPDQEQRLLDAVQYLLFAGEVARAATFTERVVACADGARRGYTLGRLAFLGGDHARAEELLARAWEACDPGAEPALGAHIAGLLAQNSAMRHRAAECVEWAARALAVAPADAHGGYALTSLATGLVFGGRGTEAREAVERSAEPGSDPVPAEIDVLLARGMVGLWTDDPAGACRDLSAVAAAARAPLEVRINALGFLADAEYRRGSWDDALLHGELAVSMARDADQIWLEPGLRSQAMYVPAGRGEWERADAHGAAAAALEWNHNRVEPLASARAFLAFAQGDPDGVLRAVQPMAVPAPGQEAALAPGVWPWHELHVDALVTLGSLDEAGTALCDYERAAAACRVRSSMANLARVRGRLHAAQGRRDDAEGAFFTGLAHAENVEMPFDRALLQLAYGQFLRRTGQRRRAAEQLRAGEEVFGQLRARPFLERCQQELAACGLAPTKRRERDPARLTPQEEAVARLVAAGLTNRQVAGELLISAKTVQFHLASVYTKLGVNTRTQLALRLTQN